MNYAARYGHLDVVKWLHENRREGCTENAMNCAAQYGNLDNKDLSIPLDLKSQPSKDALNYHYKIFQQKLNS